MSEALQTVAALVGLSVHVTLVIVIGVGLALIAVLVASLREALATPYIDNRTYIDNRNYYIIGDTDSEAARAALTQGARRPQLEDRYRR